ncbi:MAG: hypothetical protein NC452_13185 [Eubacterium sp.]|nr:hypothetical protein [Eubacterium sp.]
MNKFNLFQENVKEGDKITVVVQGEFGGVSVIPMTYINTVRQSPTTAIASPIFTECGSFSSRKENAEPMKFDLIFRPADCLQGICGYRRRQYRICDLRQHENQQIWNARHTLFHGDFGEIPERHSL